MTTANSLIRHQILKDPDGTEDQFSAIGDLGFNVLGVLHNLLKTENTKECFESCGAVETLLSFYRSQFPKYRMTALLCLAYLVDEENNDLIMATEGISLILYLCPCFLHRRRGGPSTCLPPMSVARVRSQTWRICWFSTRHRQVFLRALRFSPSLNNQQWRWLDLLNAV